eukprot:gene38159-46368_t
MQATVLLQVLVLLVALVHSAAFQSLFARKSHFSTRPKAVITRVSAAAEEGGVVAATNLEARQAPTDPAVFLGNCPFDLQETQVAEIVQQRLGGSNYKSISYIKNRETGTFRGFCYINFNSPEDAEAAVGKLQGLVYNDRELKVDLKASQPLKPRRDKRERAPRAEGGFPKTPKVFFDHTIYVGNLDYSTSKDEVMSLCNEALGEGVTKLVRMSTDRETGRGKGYCHVDFGTAEDAARALDALNGRQLGGRTLRVNAAMRKEDLPPAAAEGSAERSSRPPAEKRKPGFDNTRSIFLGNLSFDVTPELLNDMLNDVVGENKHVSIRMSRDQETGRSRGFAHVEFREAEDAQNAVQALTGISLLDRPLKVDIAAAKR